MDEPAADAPDPTQPPLAQGYRLSFILDPDGHVRQVAEASGIAAWPQSGYVGRTLGEISRERAGAERGDLWDVRVELAREATTPALYLDRVPGAPPDAPETVSSTVIPVRTSDGELESIVVVIEDRAEVGPREAQVRLSEARFRHLAESLPQMVWESDGAGNVRYFSPKWEEFTGRPVRDLLGRGYADLLHPDDVERLTAVREAANGQQVASYRLRRHDGEYRWIEAHMTMIRDEHGAPLQALGTALDVTDRRSAEEARLRSQKREMVGTLLGGVAHDFNNVISAILSNATLARREFAAGLPADTSLAEIERGAARAADLVRRVLLQGRDDAVTEGPVDLGAVAREACDLLRSGLPRTIRLVVHIDEALPPVLGDATQVHQIVVNLVTNARQAIGRADGTITVTASAGGAGIVGASGAGDDRASVVLRVADDGPGMADDVRERAFDPYFTTKPLGEGTGLGLSAVQTIVRSYGGLVEIESAPGAGTTVAVALPVATEPEPDAAAGDADELATDRRLMFVDDEAPLVKLAERALPADGLSPIGFTDAVDARTAFDAAPHRWSALVTDLSMPGLDGLSLIEHVRSARPDLPIVLTSGYLRPDDRARAHDLGVAVVPKPCSMADLAEAVRAASS